MSIERLGYIGLNSERIEEWAAFGSRFLGLQIAEQTRDLVRFRMDDRKQRIIVRRGAADCGLTGWEVADATALDALAARLDGADVQCRHLGAGELALRGAAGGIRFDDPAGSPVEVIHGAEADTAPFAPGRPVSGFRTGPLGVGHMVYLTPDIAPLRRFYEDLLGFQLSDYATEPFEVSFYHVNARHHSFALVQGSAPRIHHLMVEMNHLDDVGQGYDLALAQPGLVATTLGRHINDLMTSYYVRSPDGFFVECGWGGRSIDPEAWTPFELRHGTSLWGHDRDWLGGDALAEVTRLRTEAAEAGMRQPVQVADPAYQLGAAPMAWWETDKPAPGAALP